MPSTVESLFWITLCGVLAPLLAGSVFRRKVPEVVLLLVLGVVIGPNVLDLAVNTDGVNVLRQLGLGMLFLLAGYEIEIPELVGRGGRRALATWVVSFALAAGLIGLLGAGGAIHSEVAVAIALTSTALGTLLPILKDSGMLGTPFGDTLMKHGAYGELGPIVAISVLLGTRGPLASLLVLAAFALLAVLVHLFSVPAEPGGLEAAAHRSGSGPRPRGRRRSGWSSCCSSRWAPRPPPSTSTRCWARSRPASSCAGCCRRVTRASRSSSPAWPSGC